MNNLVSSVNLKESHVYETVSQGHIIRLTNGPEELTEEAALHERKLHKESIQGKSYYVKLLTKSYSLHKHLIMVWWTYNVKEEWDSSPKAGVCPHERRLMG